MLRGSFLGAGSRRPPAPRHVARLEFPRETGLILRCAGKAGNPFQTTEGSKRSASWLQIRAESFASPRGEMRPSSIAPNPDESREAPPNSTAQRKRASPRGEAGTSGFLSVSDSDRRVPAELGGNSGQDISPLWGRVLATEGCLPSLTPLPISVTTQVPKFSFQIPLLLGDPAGQCRRMPTSGLGSWELCRGEL